MTDEEIKVSLSALLARAHRRKSKADNWFAGGVFVLGLLGLGSGFEFASQELGFGGFLSVIIAILSAGVLLAGLGHLGVKVDERRGRRLAGTFRETFSEATGDYARALAVLRASKTDSEVEKNLQEALDRDVSFDPAAMPKAGGVPGGGLLGGLGRGGPAAPSADGPEPAQPEAAKARARPARAGPDYVPLDPYDPDD